MNIVYYPAGGRDFASSRLRVHKIADELVKLGHQVVINGSPFGPKADVMVVQKRTDIYGLIFEARERGIRVIYDVDDWLPALADERTADVITVDTPAKLELYPSAVVIPDCLDVEDNHPQKSVHAENLTTIMWMGNPENLYHLKNVYAAREGLPISIVIVTNTNSSVFREIASEFPIGCVFAPWALKVADEYLIDPDLFVAPFVFDGPHSSEWVKSKSANRILKAWALGLPVAGTAIPSYTEAGLRYQAQTVEEWRDILTQLQDPVLRIQDARRGQEYAQSFTADKVVQQWLEVFNG